MNHFKGAVKYSTHINNVVGLFSYITVTVALVYKYLNLGGVLSNQASGNWCHPGMKGVKVISPEHLAKIVFARL